MRRRIVIRHKGVRPRMCVFATVDAKDDWIEESVQALLWVQRFESVVKIETAAGNGNGSSEAGSSCGAASASAAP